MVDRWYGFVAGSLRGRVRDLERCVERGSIDCVDWELRWLRWALEEWFPWDECYGDPACYAVKAVVGAPSDGVYAPGGLPVAFSADWWVEFDTLPLVDEDLNRWAAAVSLILSDHNQPFNIGLGVSRNRTHIRLWRVHLILKHNEEYDALGVNILTVLSMWLGEAWGTKDIEVNYLSHAEKTVITFFFESYDELPPSIKELLSYVGYSLSNVPEKILVGRLGL